MTSLTEISILTRKAVIGVVIFIVAIILLRVAVGLTYNLFFKPQVATLEPPNTRFDKLPFPQFPSNLKTSQGIEFTLLNIEGKPPETTMSARVYSMPKKLPSLLADQKAKTYAARLDFTEEPKILSSTQYLFFHPQERGKTLELDIVNMNFRLKYNWERSPQYFSDFPFILKDKAISEVKKFITVNNLFDESIFKGEITFQPFKYDKIKGDFIKAASLSTAHAVRLDFFRPDVANMKILPPEFDKSFIYAIYSPIKEIEKGILEISYTFWPIDESNFATYPLRSSDTAWKDLQQGKASIVSFGQNSQDKVIIREIYLAYYDSYEPQVYLQPIFVFEGDNDFIAYLPAVSQEWLE